MEHTAMQQEIEIKVFRLVEAITIRKIGLDEPLLTSGLVDSISAVDLALEMETEFGIEMPAEKIHVHMETARTLVGYVIATHH
jgi:D-alanine--poly(phosphoribitol) ligase subunit 2